MMQIGVGDWVSFYRSGELVLGVVRYIRKRKTWEQEDELATDAGSVAADMVLEVRRSGALRHDLKHPVFETSTAS